MYDFCDSIPAPNLPFSDRPHPRWELGIISRYTSLLPEGWQHLSLCGVSSLSFTLTFSEPISQHQYKRFYLRNGSSIFWGRGDSFYCLLPGTRETRKRMYVLWLQGGNLRWEVVVWEGRWAREDCSAHTHCSSQRVQLADLCMVSFHLSPFSNTLYYFSLLGYSLLPCHSYSSPASLFLFKHSPFKNNRHNMIDRYLTDSTSDPRGPFPRVPTETSTLQFFLLFLIPQLHVGKILIYRSIMPKLY